MVIGRNQSRYALPSVVKMSVDVVSIPRVWMWSRSQSTRTVSSAKTRPIVLPGGKFDGRSPAVSAIEIIWPHLAI